MIDFEWTPLFGWLANYLVHSTALLAAAWLLDASGLLRTMRSREFAWRLALAGGLLTASVHAALPGVSLTGQASLTASRPAAVNAPTLPPHAPDTVADTSTDAPDSEAALARATPVTHPVPETGSFTSISVDTLLLTAWLAGAALLLLRFAVTGWLAMRELRGREPVTTGNLPPLLAALCEKAGIRAIPRLSRADALPGPLALPNGEICVPRWAEETLPAAALEAMLAHELAHVRRQDPLVLLGAMLLTSVLFLQPLNRLAQRRLAALAEFNADAFAARLTGRPRALAEALTHCAEQLHARLPARRTLHAGVAMATTRSPLFQRVERLMGGSIMQDQGISRFMPVLGFAALAGAVLALPAFGPAQAGTGSNTRISIHENDGSSRMQIEIGRPGYFLHVETDGRVEFNEAENDVASVEKGARIVIREQRDGTLHELAIENEDGELQREYARDRKQTPFDAEARAWLARVIPDVLRNTAINAEERIARIHKQGRNKAVLEELGRIESDYALARYATIFVSKYTLDERDVSEVLRHLESVDSDFELRNALGAVATDQSLSPPNQERLLKVATSIDSDFEAAELAALITPKLAGSAQVLDEWRVLVKGIGSDFEQRRALTPVFERRLPLEWRLAALEVAATEMGSGFELRSLLEHAAATAKGDDAFVRAYGSAVDVIGSDFEAREAVVALIRNGELDINGYTQAFDMLAGIGSDFEVLQALKAIAAAMPHDDNLLTKYRRVAEGLSRHEREQAERALRR